MKTFKMGGGERSIVGEAIRGGGGLGDEPGPKANQRAAFLVQIPLEIENKFKTIH